MSMLPPGSRQVWRFPLAPSLDMPHGARIVHLDHTRGRPQLWAEVDPGAPTYGRRFHWFVTGATIPPLPPLLHRGTVISPEGFVLHVYEEVSDLDQ